MNATIWGYGRYADSVSLLKIVYFWIIMKNIHIVLKKCEFLSNEISIFMRELLTTQGDGGHMILRTQFFEAPIIYISFDQYTIFMLLPLIHWENNFYLLVHLILKSM